MAIQIGSNHCIPLSSRRAGTFARYAFLFVFSIIAPAYGGSLDGNWKCDDGGIYTIAQHGLEVTWTGTARIDYHCSAGGLSGLADGR